MFGAAAQDIDGQTSAKAHMFILLGLWGWVITSGSLSICVCVCDDSVFVCVRVCKDFHLALVYWVAGGVLQLNNGCYINIAWPYKPHIRARMSFFLSFFSPTPK